MDIAHSAAHALSKGWILSSDTKKIKDQKVEDERDKVQNYELNLVFHEGLK